MPDKLSGISRGWWDYTTLADEIICAAAALTGNSARFATLSAHGQTRRAIGVVDQDLVAYGFLIFRPLVSLFLGRLNPTAR